MPRVIAFRSEKIKKLLLNLLQGDKYASQGVCREQSAEYAVVWLFSCQEFILVEEPSSAVNLVPSDEQGNNKNKHNPGH